MRRPRRGWIAALAVIPLTLIVVMVHAVSTWEGDPFTAAAPPPDRGSGLGPNPGPNPGHGQVFRLDDAETRRLGWDPFDLDRVFGYADGLGSDVLLIVTDGTAVAALGDLETPRPLHSIRKALLSALVGRHLGAGERSIDLAANLADLGIDDAPAPLTPLQRQATVLHLLQSTSGINHAAAAEEGLVAEKKRRLGEGENLPGTIWAYNNWDTNALTTVFEMRTGLPVAEAFEAGLAAPLGLRDHAAGAVSYVAAPDLSRHRAAMFRMSARDLARFGMLYLQRGELDGRRILPAGWVDRITADYSRTGMSGLRHGHGYLWWVPAPDSGLPPGTFWAWGLGQQALLVVPAWRSVIVHQADMQAFLTRFFQAVEEDGQAPEAALEMLALFCLGPRDRQTAFCRDDRLILRHEFAQLVSLIAAARR
ncbi:serine hydrolase domain-containing protein [Pelagibius sp.]|uniref:serine hydrolase domain-containing protein n=1 Tax=Pelagibius sp. TaxID=1931238 RepID=UPI003B514B90